MKHIKYIFEMNWATSNRLGGDYNDSDESIRIFLKEYPDAIKNGHVSMDEFEINVMKLVNQLGLTDDDLRKIEKGDLIFKGEFRSTLRDHRDLTF